MRSIFDKNFWMIDINVLEQSNHLDLKNIEK